MTDEGVPTAPFARRLNQLIRTRRHPDGSAWSVPKVADAIGVSRQHVWSLAKGSAAPKWEHVVALAEIFGVTTDSFANDLDEEEQQREDAMTVFARAGQEMSVESLNSIKAFIQLLEHQQRTESDDGNTQA